MNKKYLKRVPANFSDDIILTYENDQGSLLGFKQFKNGKFKPASDIQRMTSLTTMLLGTATHIYNHLESTFPEFKAEVLKPNGFTSASFSIKYIYNKGEIFIIRYLEKTKFFKGLLATEYPKNYSLLIAFNFENNKDQEDIEALITEYLMANNVKSKRIKKLNTTTQV